MSTGQRRAYSRPPPIVSSSGREPVIYRWQLRLVVYNRDYGVAMVMAGTVSDVLSDGVTVWDIARTVDCDPIGTVALRRRG